MCFDDVFVCTSITKIKTLVCNKPLSDHEFLEVSSNVRTWHQHEFSWIKSCGCTLYGLFISWVMDWLSVWPVPLVKYSFSAGSENSLQAWHMAPVHGLWSISRTETLNMVKMICLLPTFLLFEQLFKVHVQWLHCTFNDIRREEERINTLHCYPIDLHWNLHTFQYIFYCLYLLSSISMHWYFRDSTNTQQHNLESTSETVLDV